MKDPAVLFYTSDFLSGVTFLSMEQRGQYITLLCTQHQHGSIPENHMILICGSLDSPVIKKFEKDIDGTYYNARMREETEKRKKYSESRSNNKKGKTKTDKDRIISKSYDNHMGNENINENIINKDKKVLEQKLKKYQEHLLKQTVCDRLGMNLCIKPDAIKQVIVEFIETCYGEIVLKPNEFSVETYFIHWVKAKPTRVHESIENQAKKRHHEQQLQK